MKNKIAVILVAAVLSVTAFAGCTNTEGNSTSGNENSAASSEVSVHHEESENQDSSEHNEESEDQDSSEHHEESEKSCCHGGESDDEMPDCCKNKKAAGNTEEPETSDIPDCCGGE